MSDLTDAFRAALAEAGILYDGELIADGQRHRFAPDGDRKENAVYQLWNDGQPAGWAKDYKRDVYITWSAKNGVELTDAERRPGVSAGHLWRPSVSKPRPNYGLMHEHEQQRN